MKVAAPASLSMDLDNRWSYLRIHGNPGWEAYSSFLPALIPRVLDLLDKYGIRLTFFAVGRDLENSQNHEYFQEIHRRGHEIGNHSYNHESWFHLYSLSETIREIQTTEDLIERVVGIRPTGFRGPGFSTSVMLFEILAGRGYSYDASTLPTFIGPLARFYYLSTVDLDASERQKRNALFGSFRDGFRPLKPHRIATRQGSLVELPVTTMPGIRVPIHLSYLLWLASYSMPVSRFYWRFALRLCRLWSIAPSFLLHPLDFLGLEDAPDLAFFPCMGMEKEAKLDYAREVLEIFLRDFAPTPLSAQVARYQKAPLQPG